MDLQLKIRTFIKEKRIAAGLSAAEVANIIWGKPKLGYFISDIEKGKRSITVTTLGKILESLKSDIEFIEN